MSAVSRFDASSPNPMMRSSDGRHPGHRAHRWIAGGGSRLRSGDVGGRPFVRRDHQHSRAPTRSWTCCPRLHPGCAEAPTCAGRSLREIRPAQEGMTVERTEVLEMMGELKLYGMKSAYDETLATALKRKHEPQQLVGDLLKAEISEKQARSIRYQLTIAKLPLATDVNDFAFKDTLINENLVRDLAGGVFVAQQRNVVLVGGTGTGKTRDRDRTELYPHRIARPLLQHRRSRQPARSRGSIWPSRAARRLSHPARLHRSRRARLSSVCAVRRRAPLPLDQPS